MTHIPNTPPQSRSMLDHLVVCLWWLSFLGVAAAGLVLALWLVLPPLPGLLLIVACWLGGNAAGWTLAARADAALTRRIRKGRKRLPAAYPATATPPHCGFPRVHGTVRILSPGPACP